MLPSEHRLRTSSQFRTAVRRGRRGTSRTMVLHLVRGEASGAPGSPPAQVGFVVSKGVGDAVVRNRVRRRLRHLVAARLGALRSGDLLVVRALPASAEASDLGADLDGCLARVTS